MNPFAMQPVSDCAGHTEHAGATENDGIGLTVLHCRRRLCGQSIDQFLPIGEAQHRHVHDSNTAQPTIEPIPPSERSEHRHDIRQDGHDTDAIAQTHRCQK